MLTDAQMAADPDVSRHMGTVKSALLSLAAKGVQRHEVSVGTWTEGK